MKIYEHMQEFKIKYCDVDFKDDLKVSTALAFMEEVAGDSAEELGFGYTYIKPREYAFVVCNVYMEFRRPLTLGERVLVKTWPSIPSRVVFGREYQFENSQGEGAIYATSRWCLIDSKTGKLLPSKVIDNQNYATYNTKKLFDGIGWKLPVFSVEEGELKFSITIANSEYDHNMHVNNTRYADYCLNCFTVQELSALKLKRFMISYVKQCREGEKLSFYRKKCERGEYLIQGINEKREIVTQASIVTEDNYEEKCGK